MVPGCVVHSGTCLYNHGSKIGRIYLFNDVCFILTWPGIIKIMNLKWTFIVLFCEHSDLHHQIAHIY